MTATQPTVYHPIVPIVDFCETLFRQENGKLLKLLPHQKKILKLAFTPNAEGKLPYSTVLYSCPKKSGKTTVNSMISAWFAFCVCEPNDTIIMVANSREHVQSRAYRGLRKALELEPSLRQACDTIGLRKIITKTGVEIEPLSTEYGTASGANFSLVSMDEIWAMVDESSRRLYEELTPVPTRKNSVRLITTYAGWNGVSDILENLYDRGMQGTCIDTDLGIYVNEEAGLFMYWDHRGRFPWHNDRYYFEQRSTLRPSAYDRLHKNEWTSGESGLDPVHWQRCVAEGKRLEWTREKAWESTKEIYLAVGVDASVKHDRAAVVTCFRRRVKDMDEEGNFLGTQTEKIFLGPYKVWQPTPDKPLDFEETIEKFILYLQKHYMLGPVYYDPFQMVRSQQSLWKKGVDMVEWTQTVPHGIEMCRHLTDLLSHTNLVLYDDEGLQQEAFTVSLKEVPEKGFRITKSHENKKIDTIIALSMAALAAELCPSSDDTFRDALLILR